MAEGETNSDGPNAAPSGGVRDAVVEQRSRPSLVWVIPIVAVLVGAWLTYHTFSQRGPAVTISFQTAEGLEAGKTKVKYKDVEIGSVESIELSDDLSHVIVTLRLVKHPRGLRHGGHPILGGARPGERGTRLRAQHDFFGRLHRHRPGIRGRAAETLRGPERATCGDFG